MKTNKTLSDITGAEVDEFINNFGFKGLATLTKVDKQNKRICDSPYEWAKNIKYSVKHHFNEWFDISAESLAEPGIEITPKGILFRRNECTLTLFKLTKNGNDLLLQTFKKSFTISGGLFGVPSFQMPYFNYFMTKGFSYITERNVFLESGLLKKEKVYTNLKKS